MRFIVLLIPAVLAAAPAFAQPAGKTSDQATEEGREKNTQFAKDATLTSKVHTALMNDVGSDNGVVTLKGKVGGG